ncbi:hypothetical protein HELRODRAFT_158509 [Helobdella robusta]|uniref:Uncharacterized protein n=1 Tax=Helobdella robusta TaxID=6412 RepID=T1EMV8_HELRO|nr:hypothetical protein HELRODRAFT_158509 [Helobdella robusta]ESO12088.1 hypothetical protein HELRODRAFT_158509 [Helobdella robusta]
MYQTDDSIFTACSYPHLQNVNVIHMDIRNPRVNKILSMPPNSTGVCCCRYEALDRNYTSLQQFVLYQQMACEQQHPVACLCTNNRLASKFVQRTDGSFEK